MGAGGGWWGREPRNLEWGGCYSASVNLTVFSVLACNPLQSFFCILLPIMRPTAVTVAILNAMWIWNDYLLPYLVLGTDQKTVPVTIQIAMQGAYGATDYGGLMAMLILAILPIIGFYLVGQKYIISGVVAGAVKG